MDGDGDGAETETGTRTGVGTGRGSANGDGDPWTNNRMETGRSARNRTRVVDAMWENG